MFECGTIVELSNNKKYILTDKTKYDDNIYYLALEIELITNTPTDNSEFFKYNESDNTFKMIKDENVVMLLKTIFVNKFLSEYEESDN